MLLVTDKVKDYEVIAPLGSGGMATLYLARRRGVGGFSRLVTLKLVHKHLVQDEAMVERFLEEARISAHIAHPNVVHVEEVGRLGDGYFIAMEYVHGVSLSQLLERMHERGMRMRPTLCVWLAAQVAEALHAAHEAKGENGLPLGIVHHDVSPQNVLIAHTGHVKLIDFGIAQCAQGEPSPAGNMLLGKLRYMSPEQLRQEPADRKSDVYALGVMLWEMLAGRCLFRCHGVDDERDWATREEPPPPSRYSPYCMPWLDKVVLKALACDPRRRYASALELRSELLEADPSALRLDAPLVASLLHSLLGEELDKRRADWPSEVAGALGAEAQAVSTQPFSAQELTASLASPSAELVLRPGRHERDDEREPTQVGDDSVRARWEQGLSALYERFSVLGGLPSKIATACATARHRTARRAQPPALPRPITRVNTRATLTARSFGWSGLTTLSARAARWTAQLRLLQRRAALAFPWQVLTRRAWRGARLAALRHRMAIVGSLCLLVGLMLGNRLSRGMPLARANVARATLQPTAAIEIPAPRAALPVLLGSVAPPRSAAPVSALTSCPREEPAPVEVPRVLEEPEPSPLQAASVSVRRVGKYRTAISGRVGPRKLAKRTARLAD